MKISGGPGFLVVDHQVELSVFWVVFGFLLCLFMLSLLVFWQPCGRRSLLFNAFKSLIMRRQFCNCITCVNQSSAHNESFRTYLGVQGNNHKPDGHHMELRWSKFISPESKTGGQKDFTKTELGPEGTNEIRKQRLLAKLAAAGGCCPSFKWRLNSSASLADPNSSLPGLDLFASPTDAACWADVCPFVHLVLNFISSIFFLSFFLVFFQFLFLCYI